MLAVSGPGLQCCERCWSVGTISRSRHAPAAIRLRSRPHGVAVVVAVVHCDSCELYGLVVALTGRMVHMGWREVTGRNSGRCSPFVPVAVCEGLDSACYS